MRGEGGRGEGRGGEGEGEGVGGEGGVQEVQCLHTDGPFQFSVQYGWIQGINKKGLSNTDTRNICTQQKTIRNETKVLNCLL